MKKTLSVTITLILVIASVAFTTFDQPKYKNLKVLPKDITKEQMDSTMHFFSMSLGVKCSFCHVKDTTTNKWDMASDAKPEKEIARLMYKMAAGINKEYFKTENEGVGNAVSIPTVTCYTCHHGSAFPVSMPPPRENRPDSTKRN